MEICSQHFSTEIINRIRATVNANPGMSRRALSRQVCQWLDWRRANGKFKEMSCRKALLELERQEAISLPVSDKTYTFQRKCTKATGELLEIKEIACDLKDLGKVELLPVPGRHSKKSRLWNDMLSTYHYLGAGPLCGAQIRYLIHSEVYGWLGAMSFSAAAWRLKARDQWIGWSEAARRLNLQRVVCNSRFLILPTVQVANLASHILSMSAARLGDDWQARYGYAPVLLETFVDPKLFQGACYRGANWMHIGRTAGRKEPYPNGKVSGGEKEIYLYPLCRDWQTVLCTEPVIALGSKPRPEHPQDWAEEEFGTVAFYDERLKKRLYTLANDFFAQPGVLVPQACNGSPAKTKGAYRFFANNQVNMQTLLKPHIEASVQRIKTHRVVLAPQDTTTLNYTAHPATTGLGPISKKHDRAACLQQAGRTGAARYHGLYG